MGQHFVRRLGTHERNDDLDLVARETLAGRWPGSRSRARGGGWSWVPALAESREDYGCAAGTRS